MRTTLDIADDVLMAVKDKARTEMRSTGELLSDLAREALTPRQPGSETGEPATDKLPEKDSE